mmetsp:Transcript_11515/g.42992  ORF Transcript_11515/g.42992 Transcript_11515/m.42992 type:complete len:212 (+) Transcript_11515:533-1168(+)
MTLEGVWNGNPRGARPTSVRFASDVCRLRALDRAEEIPVEQLVEQLIQAYFLDAQGFLLHVTLARPHVDSDALARYLLDFLGLCLGQSRRIQEALDRPSELLLERFLLRLWLRRRLDRHQRQRPGRWLHSHSMSLRVWQEIRDLHLLLGRLLPGALCFPLSTQHFGEFCALAGRLWRRPGCPSLWRTFPARPDFLALRQLHRQIALLEQRL